MVQKGTASDLPEAVCAAYNAPFPTEQHASGARQFPMNVPFDAGNPECERNRKDWWVLMEWTKPWQVAYGAQCTLTPKRPAPPASLLCPFPHLQPLLPLLATRSRSQ